MAVHLLQGVVQSLPKITFGFFTKVVMIAGTSATDLLEHYRAGALLVLADGDIQISSDLKDAVSLAA